MYLGYQNGKIKHYTEQPLDPTLYRIDRIEETQDEYVLNGDEYVLNDDKYQEQKAQEEKERIAMLSLTRGDVFRGLLQAKQITRAQIRAMIENNETFSILEKEMALIDFDEALNFYRGNALINVVGQTLGISSEQLDKFFETNDYTVLLTPVEEETTTEENSTVEE